MNQPVSNVLYIDLTAIEIQDFVFMLQGGAVGLVKNLALMSYISVGSQPSPILEFLEEWSMENLEEVAPSSIVEYVSSAFLTHTHPSLPMQSKFRGYIGITLCAHPSICLESATPPILNLFVMNSYNLIQYMYLSCLIQYMYLSCLIHYMYLSCLIQYMYLSC